MKLSIAASYSENEHSNRYQLTNYYYHSLSSRFLSVLTSRTVTSKWTTTTSFPTLCYSPYITILSF